MEPYICENFQRGGGGRTSCPPSGSAHVVLHDIVIYTLMTKNRCQPPTWRNFLDPRVELSNYGLIEVTVQSAKDLNLGGGGVDCLSVFSTVRANFWNITLMFLYKIGERIK